MKRGWLFIVLAITLIVATLYFLFPRQSKPLVTSITNQAPLEVWTGGACTCPVEPRETIKLYKSLGDDLDKIKQENEDTICDPMAGCSAPVRYELYP